MDSSLHSDITLRLAEFHFKPKGKWLREGVCPGGGQKELYTHAESPWLLKCNRINNCGYEAHVKELYPDLFDNWSNRYPALPAKNPNATADAYMQYAPGFDLKKYRAGTRRKVISIRERILAVPLSASLSVPDIGNA